VKHEDAFRRLPDLLEDRDDAELLGHVRRCPACQRQLFLLGRVDRALRQGTPTRSDRRPIRLLAGAAAVAAAAAAAALLAALLPSNGHADTFMLRTTAGVVVGEATMTHSDARNVSLSLTARGLPVGRGHMFVLWASDRGATMQAGRFMADPKGRAHVRFNLPADHDWAHFWITRPGKAPTMVASSA
jgi:hypothetical protein